MARKQTPKTRRVLSVGRTCEQGAGSVWDGEPLVLWPHLSRWALRSLRTWPLAGAPPKSQLRFEQSSSFYFISGFRRLT